MAEKAPVDLDFEFREAPVRRLAGMPHKGEYQLIGSVFDKVKAWAESRDIAFENTIGIYYDNPSWTLFTSWLRSHACVELPEGVELSDEDRAAGLEELEVGGGMHLVALLRGGYEDLAKAYGYLCGTVLRRKGMFPSNACYEIYLTEPDPGASLEETMSNPNLRTEIYIPCAEMNCTVL